PIIAMTKTALTPSVQRTTLFVGMIEVRPFRIRKVATLDKSAATTTPRLIQKALTCCPAFARPAVKCALKPAVTSLLHPVAELHRWLLSLGKLWQIHHVLL